MPSARFTPTPRSDSPIIHQIRNSLKSVTIEGFHPQMGKVLKTKGAFTDQDACLKLASLGIQNISKNWNRPMRNWNNVW